MANRPNRPNSQPVRRQSGSCCKKKTKAETVYSDPYFYGSGSYPFDSNHRGDHSRLPE